MVFSSLHFLTVFLPGFLAVYYLTPVRFRNLPALAASLLFYAWGAPKLVVYLALSCLIDYGAARLIARADRTPAQGRWIAAAAIAFNVALLVYFKYANFFVHEMNALLARLGVSPLAWSEVALPIGISFFTFHRVSYIVDVYRRVTPPARTYTDYLLYILLFPQLIAGPIVRYREVAGEIGQRTHSLTLFLEGIHRFSLGLGKKVLLANVLGEVADRIFALPPASLGPLYAWWGILSYTFQIFFDFSGYSDMAVGLARMIGIHFPENFNHPYIARSITEFWRRWHISLSSFMRDYLYIPLGGNRGTGARTYFNLWVVFLISGFWHGASWTYLLWGAYHGFFLVVDRVFWRSRAEKLPAAISIGLTFFIVLLGWVLFRSADLPTAIQYTGRLFGLGGAGPAAASAPAWQQIGGIRTLFTLGLAVVLAFLPAVPRPGVPPHDDRARGLPGPRGALRLAGSLLLTLLSLSYLGNNAFNPFIYFRF